MTQDSSTINDAMFIYEGAARTERSGPASMTPLPRQMRTYSLRRPDDLSLTVLRDNGTLIELCFARMKPIAGGRNRAITSAPCCKLSASKYAAVAVPLADVLTAASSLRVSDLPDLPTVDEGRVWPASNQWVAEVGREPTQHVVEPGMFSTWAEAVQVTRDEIEKARGALAAQLEAASGLAARLSGTRQRWAPPTLQVWASEQQTAPWVLRA